MLHLLKGRHKVTFVSEENPADRVLQVIEIADNEMEDFLQVGLRAIRTAREKRERNRRRAEAASKRLEMELAERQRKEAEEEKRRQAARLREEEKEKNKPKALKILENIQLGLVLICGIVFFTAPFAGQVWLSLGGLISFFIIGFGGHRLLKFLFSEHY